MMMKENKLDKLWENIQTDLELNYQEFNREALNKAIHQLPIYHAPEKIWLNVEQQLSPAKVFFFAPKYLKIAASVIVLLGIGLSFWIGNTTDSVHYYAEKNAVTIDLTTIADTTNNSFEKLKNATCQINPGVCTSPEFQMMTQQYHELINYQNKILQQSKISDDENLQEMLLKIETQKKQIQQQMMSMID